MSRTATLKKLLGDDWSLEFVDADGDCFFACVSKAFDGDPTTQDLRDVVADACDDETLVYGYHDPFITPSFMRRNEVCVRVQGNAVA